MTNQTCNPSIVTQALGIQATGPRTVIVPADPIIWDEETSYEYLTLVASTDFGQAYISKRDVPAGTALTETEYWIPAATFNAQLAAIQASVASLSTEFSTLSNTVESDISAINAKLNLSLTGNKSTILCIGDSYGSKIGDRGEWVEQLETVFPQFTFVNKCTSSSGWGVGPTSFESQLSSASSLTASDVLAIITIGGANNAYNNTPAATFNSAVSSYCDSVSAMFPDAIHIIGVGNWTSNHAPVDTGYFMNAMMECVGRQNTRVIPFLWTAFTGNTDLCPESLNYHPTPAGMWKITNAIIQAFYGTPNISTAYADNNNALGENIDKLTYYIHNGIIRLQVDIHGITAKGNQVTDTSDLHKALPIRNYYVMGVSPNGAYCSFSIANSLTECTITAIGDPVGSGSDFRIALVDMENF